MNCRRREECSRGLRVTVGPASRTWPPFTEWRPFTFCSSICFLVPRLAVGYFWAVPLRPPKPQSPRGRQGFWCCKGDFFPEAVFAYFLQFENQSTWISCVLFTFLAFGLGTWAMIWMESKVTPLCGEVSDTTHSTFSSQWLSLSANHSMAKAHSGHHPQTDPPSFDGSRGRNSLQGTEEENLSLEACPIWFWCVKGDFQKSVLVAVHPTTLPSWCFWAGCPDAPWKEWSQRQR